MLIPILAPLWFFGVIMRKNSRIKQKAINHYFSSEAPEGHVPDESEIPYWTVQLPEHY